MSKALDDLVEAVREFVDYGEPVFENGWGSDDCIYCDYPYRRYSDDLRNNDHESSCLWLRMKEALIKYETQKET